METSIGTSGGGIQASLGGRYAIALFDLARDARTIDTVESSLANVRDALNESPKSSPARGRGTVRRKPDGGGGGKGGSFLTRPPP